MEKTWFLKEEMDGQLFISHQNGQFYFLGNMIKVAFRICTLKWRVKNYASRQGKSIKRRNESVIDIV